MRQVIRDHFGKPGSPKISSNEQCRGWDPTDPDPANPWRTYVEPTVQPEQPKADPTPTPAPAPQPDPTPTTISVTGVSLSNTTIDLTEGETKRLTVVITPNDATNKNVTWSSSDNSIATVDSKGKVKAIAEGTATITVTTGDGGYTATCQVTVAKSAPVNEINTVVNEL